MNILLASNNKGKLAELRRLLGPMGVQFLTPAELRLGEPPVEVGKSFHANALLKATHYCRLSGLAAVADDSGLCVDALSGAPGIRSARFSGENASDEENNQLLLEKLRYVSDEDRGAEFRCAAVCLFPDGRIFQAEGVVHGRILRKGRGSRGFGYDPLFFYLATQKTFAEMEAGEKDALSHRGQAFRALAAKLSDQFRV